MDRIERYIEQIISGEEATDPPLEDFALLVSRLKEEADRHARIDPQVSLRLADEIIRVGNLVNDKAVIALGKMRRADMLWHLHINEEAWAIYNEAGDLYERLKDRVGWARTRIGRLMICVEMNAVEEALQDAETARSIFLEYGHLDHLARLETNAAVVLNRLTQYAAAIEKCETVIQLGEHDPNTLTIIAYIKGYAYQGLGNLKEAMKWYETCRSLLIERGEVHGLLLLDLNMLTIAQAQGHNKKALRLLHEMIESFENNPSLESDKQIWHLIEGLLFLNRFEEARAFARMVIERYSSDNENYDLALSLVQLASAEVAFGNTLSAIQSLDRAEQIFERLNAGVWLGIVYLKQGQAALQLTDTTKARHAAQKAVDQFAKNGQQVAYLTAVMLLTQIDLKDGQMETALRAAREMQKTVYKIQMPHLRYHVHLLLGKIAEQSIHPERAKRHYQVATALVERIQRSLVITSRNEFLADKQESIHALIRLNLQQGHNVEAFNALERAKAQVWLSYLSQLDHLRWQRDNPVIQPLIEEFEHLREEHHWYYRAAYDPIFREQHHPLVSVKEAEVEAADRERRLRSLTEQLYLYTHLEDLSAAKVVPVSAVQAGLERDTLMVAYYSDDHQLWAFVMDTERLAVYPLPKTAASVEKLLHKWQTNIDRALRTQPDAAEASQLHSYSFPIAQSLYDILIEPFSEGAEAYQRLVIVPYGMLHYLPFQALHDGDGYLIEKFEVVILPTASLLTRQPPCQKRGALSIAYDWDGRLQQSAADAQQVVDIFGGRSYHNAGQSLLSSPPTQILHISAHGEYRIDQPDFSFIQLADGPVYTDDLFQYDLSYELVTLSACETGRSRVNAADELIGLGRGFLFAGAGALIASLWRVEERLTVELMQELYQQLDSGASKAAALRCAILKLKQTYTELHPAFWGAFQLIGNADPLSQPLH